MSADLTFRGGRAGLLQKLAALPSLLSGRGVDPTGAVEGLCLAVGFQMLSIVREQFLVKSRGGTDDAGITWAALKPSTVAYGRRHPGYRPGRKKRPLLTPAQDKLWRGVYASSLARHLKGPLPAPQNARAQAAAVAWAVVKRAGGQTVLGRFGGEKVDIGRDTGRLFNSLSPGSGSPDQILRAEPGAAVVGSNLSYAAPFHARRPLWPDAGKVPQAWVDRLADTLSDGLRNVVQRLVGG